MAVDEKVRRILLIGGLCALTAGAVAISIYFAASDSTGQASADRRLHFQCERCGHQFVKELSEQELASTAVDPRVFRIDCPKCGAKGSCILMVRCPQCGKYFLPDSHRYGLSERQRRRPRDICPYCKTDRAEWFRNHYKKRK